MRKLILSILLYTCLPGHAQQIASVKMDELIRVIDTSNSPLVINFWATWCKPCIDEIPRFEEQVKAMRAEGVRLILVSLDLPPAYPEKLEAFVAKSQYTSQVLWLDETDPNTFCPRIDKTWDGGLPVTLFINKSRNYRRFVAQSLTAAKLKTALQQLTVE